MDPTIDDYQNSALFGSAPNNSALTADMLNPSASGPDDWQTVLTNGISGAAVNGINGLVNNAVQSGQIQNAITARRGGVLMTGGVISSGNGLVKLVLIGAFILLLVR